VFTDLYNKVKSGEECVRVLQSTGAPDYKKVLDAELKELGESEMWLAGAAVRKLRPVK
jgi:ketol-acid reductoisomerase